jgi:hypothetical protein
MQQRLNSGDFTAFEFMINEFGRTKQVEDVFVWATIAAKVGYMQLEFSQLAALLVEEDLTTKQVRRGYGQIAKIFTESDSLPNSRAAAEEFSALAITFRKQRASKR